MSGSRDTPPRTKASAAADAWGCEYNPADGRDAQAWLDRRQAWVEEETKTGRLQSARIPVGDLQLHPDLAE